MKKKKKTRFKKIIFILILLSLSFLLYKNYDSLKLIKILNSFEQVNGDVTYYSIFGTHLNIKGKINKKLENPKLILKNLDNEIKLDCNFELGNETIFYTSENNNDSIYLDNLEYGKYILVIKDKDKYYTLLNKTDYSNLEYYSLTKDSINKKINIDFKKKYIKFSIAKSKLPDAYYDITIDAGHGNIDSGSIATLNGKSYHEADITLDIAITLKEELEDYGYKVKLTRENKVDLDEYGENGRAVIPNKVKSKYSFSIHLNSSEGKMNYGGVEVYVPNNIDYKLASSIADFVADTNLGYSKKIANKISDGIYYEYFSLDDINESKEDMLSKGYNPYDIKAFAPTMYMIREVGGISTFAYVDDRNDKISKNIYYNSNHTAEPYLIEVGYMSYDKDLKYIVNNKNEIATKIRDGIINYLKVLN